MIANARDPVRRAADPVVTLGVRVVSATINDG
jgi:hypothetical protein